jgi:hypothetical protein
MSDIVTASAMTFRMTLLMALIGLGPITSARARLGETIEQSIARYGKVVARAGDTVMFHAGEYDISVQFDQGRTVLLLFACQGLWSQNDVKQILATEGISTQVVAGRNSYESATATASFDQSGGFYDSEGWHEAEGFHRSDVFRRNLDNFHEIRGNLTIASKAYLNKSLEDNEKAVKKF